MPIASTLAWVKGVLNGLPMPGINTPAMVAYITPPGPERRGAVPDRLRVADQRARVPGRPAAPIPRNTGPGTPSGFKPINHMVDVFIV